MKPIKLLISLILSIMLFACKSDEKKDLLGIWESFETHHDKIAITFYQDSLVLDAFNGDFHTISEWTLDENKIHLFNVNLSDSIIKQEISYKYNLNKTKDTLYIKVVDGDNDDYSTMKKVDSNPFTPNKNEK
ncbi:hypothetical protein [Winogradskyella ouciana]|uniref:hypothetical protein n=1 Tax=Winogradskyella ouciana TaxID=2608631 RepID=UPI003D2805E5